MGNFCCCWRAQVNHHHCPNPTKIASPEKTGEDHETQTSPPRKSTQFRGGGGELEVPAGEAAPAGTVMASILPKIYTLSEMKSVTNNFRPDSVLGQGGFGRVYRGWVDERTLAPAKVGAGVPVAVKRSNPDSEQGLEEWEAEVNFLGKFSHPNLVRLLGYCWEDTHFLLMYEYMQKGSLENHLFRRAADPIPWDLRFKIAIGAARGLDFLHTSENSVIYRDFKSSNILLDADFNAKLSDFGLAKLGPVNGKSHVTTRIMGTYGYAAPEYFATGHLYVRSDVYGFGVVLLEMLTGLPMLDTNRPRGKHNLVEWASPSLTDKKKLKRIMDPKIEGHYPIEGALQAAELILKCLECDPKNRPGMDEVLVTLEAIRSVKETSTNTEPPKNEVSSSSSSNRHHNQNHNRFPIHHPMGGGGGRGNRAYQHPPKSRDSDLVTKQP